MDGFTLVLRDGPLTLERVLDDAVLDNPVLFATTRVMMRREVDRVKRLREVNAATIKAEGHEPIIRQMLRGWQDMHRQMLKPERWSFSLAGFDMFRANIDKSFPYDSLRPEEFMGIPYCVEPGQGVDWALICRT